MKPVVNTIAVVVLANLSTIAAAREPIVITATRTAQTADESLAAVTVITRAEIAASQAQDVAELLRFHAGLDIGRNGGPGQTTSVFLRGTESNHVLVLLDGVKLNPGTIGAASWQNLNPEHIERIEVVRGPRSTLYGSDAIGGVIQIFTRRAAPGTQAEASAGAGRYATREAAFGASHDDGVWRAGVHASGLDSRGFPARVGGSEDSGYRNTGVNAYGGTKLGALDAEVNHWQTRGNSEYYDFALAPLDQDFFNSVTALSLKAPLAAAWLATLRVSQLRDEIDQNQSLDFTHTERKVVDWQNDFQLGRQHLLSAGLYLAREHTEARSYGSSYNVDTATNAVFLQSQWRFGDQQLLAAWRYTDIDSFGGHHTGDLGYGLQLTPALRLTASAGSGFRAPDSTDRFGFGGNPTLAPETSRSYELGARLRLTPDQAVRASAFQNDIDNLINYVDPDGFSGPLPGKNQNVDRARIRGLELGYTLNWRPWRFNLEASAQNPENRDTGRQLARRATHSLTFGTGYADGPISAGLDLFATGRRPDSDFSDQRLPGYALVNLVGQYRLDNHWTLRARLENLFDRHYELAQGYNTTRRAAYLQVHYQIGAGP
ncbi:MAG: TonB-dependent receptor [Gammaproteobacteria bacterium]|nr:TonB-dependent receptor [Gammaproteobacteria bacterium]